MIMEYFIMLRRINFKTNNLCLKILIRIIDLERKKYKTLIIINKIETRIFKIITKILLISLMTLVMKLRAKSRKLSQ